MTRIEGIETVRNAAGEITHLTIDVQKQQELAAPILEQLSINKKTAFQNEWEQAINVEDARKRSLQHIDELWDRSK
jgi:hypothetical protein